MKKVMANKSWQIENNVAEICMKHKIKAGVIEVEDSFDSHFGYVTAVDAYRLTTDRVRALASALNEIADMLDSMA